MVIGAIDAALENGEIAFDGVGVGIATNLFLSAVVDGFIACELGADDAVLTSIVRH
jgi:hypothetical protein